MSYLGLIPLTIPDLYHWTSLLGFLFLLLITSKLYLRWRQLVKTFRAFPGPKRHWLYGNAHEFKQDGTDLDIVLGYAETYRYGYPMWLGNFFASLIVCHPEYAKAIISRQDPKDDFAYRFITPWIGKGLLVLSGPKWFQHRRLLTPGFHYDVLKPYVRLMSDCANTMLDKWEKVIPNQKPVELFHYVSLMALDTIMKCAFSYQSDCQNNSENAYIKAVYDLSYLVDHRFRVFPYHNDLIYYLSPHGFRFRRALKVAHEHTDKVIKQRKASLKHEKELEKIQQKRHLDFLDILLYAKDENGQGLSDEDLRAEVDTFMFEGHDTTTSAISWILYCMAKYPEHQQKCREEISEVLGERDTVNGTNLLLSIYAMNRHSSVWEDPEVFDPLRFTPENTSNRHTHAFLPFSAGARNCIGQNFAMNEIKVSVALTLQRFELLPEPGHEPLKVPQLVLRSVNGVYVNLAKT